MANLAGQTHGARASYSRSSLHPRAPEHTLQTGAARMHDLRTSGSHSKLRTRHAPCITQEPMRFAVSNRIVAAMAGAALLASGGAQALLLLGCGPGAAMTSCCCPKQHDEAPQPMRVQAGERICCSVTPPPSRHEEA